MAERANANGGGVVGRQPPLMFDPQVEFLSLEDIDISEFNVRRREITADLDELAKSLDRFGLHQPIVVARKGNRFAVVVGQRRYLAAKQLGWDQISALILTQPPEQVQAAILSLSENIQRRDLSARDKSDAFVSLLDALGSVAAVAEAVGVTDQTVRNWLGYAAVPEPIKELVQERGLTRDQATRIARHVEEPQAAVEIARRVSEAAVKKDRDRILESARELPGRPAATILRRAEQKQKERRIIFVLPESSALAMEQAESQLGTEASDIAMSATTGWLQDNGYLR